MTTKKKSAPIDREVPADRVSITERYTAAAERAGQNLERWHFSQSSAENLEGRIRRQCEWEGLPLPEKRWLLVPRSPRPGFSGREDRIPCRMYFYWKPEHLELIDRVCDAVGRGEWEEPGAELII